MKKLFLGLVFTVTLVGCSHMPGVVKDVNWDKDGNLQLTKCDETHYWILYFLLWGETNCRQELRKL
jgi:hypothetical protein